MNIIMRFLRWQEKKVVPEVPASVENIDANIAVRKEQLHADLVDTLDKAKTSNMYGVKAELEEGIARFKKEHSME